MNCELQDMNYELQDMNCELQDMNYNLNCQLVKKSKVTARGLELETFRLITEEHTTRPLCN
jgi:hypothetical protein